MIYKIVKKTNVIVCGGFKIDYYIPSRVSDEIEILSVRKPPSDLRQRNDAIEFRFTIQTDCLAASRNEIARFRYKSYTAYGIE